ncbi:MAG: autotransporter-associated beta strand repeat-containing protein, partial [Thermoguttaceae bacterium]
MTAIFFTPHLCEGCVYWATTTGDWSEPANWGGTRPTIGIDVAICNGGTATITHFDEACGSLVLGDFEDGHSGTILMSGGSLFASREYIGRYGTGVFTQAGGINTVDGNFYLGLGTYNLNGGTLTVKTISKGSEEAVFNFGGGTLKANASFSTTVPMNLTGDANVDTAGYAVVLSGGLSGSGGLNKLGSNTLILSGVNSYNNGTTINSGNLVFSLTSAIPSTGNIIVNSNGALNVAGAYTTVAGWLGSNKIHSGSTGTLALTADNSETFDMGRYANLSLGATGSCTFSGVMVPASNTYRFGGGGGTITVSSNLSGERSLVANGSVSLSGVNDYTGNTDINQGVLSISSTAALPGWSTAGRYTVASGAVLAVGDGIASDDAVTMLGTGNFHSGSAIGFDTHTFDGSVLPSNVGLMKTGTGTLTLSKALTNTTGAITVAGGTFDLGGFSQETSGNVVLQNGAIRNGTLRKSGGSFDFQAGAVSANLADGASATGLVKNGTGRLTLSGSNTFSDGV